MIRSIQVVSEAFFCGALALARRIPSPLAARLGRGVGLLWYHVLRYRRGLVAENLAAAYGLSPRDGEIRRLSRANFIHYGHLFMEMLRLRQLAGIELERTVTFVGLENLDTALARGRGAMILTAHLGNFDLQAMAVARRGYQVLIVSKPLRNKALERLWMDERASSGLRISLHRNALREILRALAHGNIVGFVLDQHARTDAVWVPFFGRPAATLRSLAVIAQRTGAPVVPMFTWRLPDGTHVVEAQPAVETETAGDSDASALHNTARYSAVVEAAVRAHPEQWTWIHRRWKQPPAAATPMAADGNPSIS